MAASHSIRFWNLAFLGCIYRKERFGPGPIRPAQPRCVVQEPNQVAVGVQAIRLCGFKSGCRSQRWTEHRQGYWKRASSSGPSKRALCCARRGCWRAPACRPPNNAPDRATASAPAACGQEPLPPPTPPWHSWPCRRRPLPYLP